MALLFGMLAGQYRIERANPAALAFGSIESVGGRINALRALANVYFQTRSMTAAQTKPLNNLLDQITAAARIRNDIANGIVSQMYKSEMREGVQGPFENVGLYLHAPDFVTGRNDYMMQFESDDPMAGQTSTNVYTLGDVISFMNKFEHLKIRIVKYAFSIREEERIRLERHEKSAEYSPDYSE